MPQFRMSLLVCAGTGCVSNNSFSVKAALEKELARQNLQEEIQVVTTGCNGFCANGPIVVVKPDDIFYQFLKAEDIPRLVEEHCLKGRPVPELMYSPAKDAPPIPKMSDIPFFGKQRLISLANRGLIDPENIDEYIALGGYQGLSKALLEMSPEGIIAEIKAAGLRGRGGAGFPTGRKWELARAAAGEEKYIICNGDEGDPGAFMDRSIVESDPHCVLEGMTIGARAIGAAQGFIYIRAEYPLALERLTQALEQARSYGLLGEDILGSGFDFDITVSKGAGAFVCGEETSLIGSLEGLLPEPRVRPPYPAQSGYRGKPTNINNVETWANVPHIINKGSAWFASVGTESCKGTKVFSLVGKIRNTGLVEVPMGISLREIVFDIGGGIPNGKKFKAVQTGGPSGGCLPESLLDLPVDYESLTKAGSIMGSGGMIVMDEETCMVEVARYFVGFTQEESCGKCPPCREGTWHMLKILEGITEGRGQEGDLELLEKLALRIKDTALCGLGNTAPNPVLTTIRHFRHEYEAHIRDKRCPGGVCKSLIRYFILEDKCTGCMACAKNCPVNCIAGERKKLHVIDQEKCIKCGMCKSVCRFDAVRIE
jgi:NADH:ubiquinone oxidoreductase subunit F (NADH-binding)/(2Fe-2S) ferredoxin/NAD-dependent dihydropyrimidine dehydrogenase PreA subunit